MTADVQGSAQGYFTGKCPGRRDPVKRHTPLLPRSTSESEPTER